MPKALEQILRADYKDHLSLMYVRDPSVPAFRTRLSGACSGVVSSFRGILLFAVYRPGWGKLVWNWGLNKINWPY